jgi:predicted type IV restriction endonuclease
MQKLKLPDYQLKMRMENQRQEIFDAFRKRFFVLTPEEWVRQNFLHYLVREKGFPAQRIAVEKGLKVNGMHRRFDAVVFDAQARARVLLEFKAPEVKLSQKTFDQASVYNLSLGVDYLIISNGMMHYAARVDAVRQQIFFLKDIPHFSQIEAHG